MQGGPAVAAVLLSLAALIFQTLAPQTAQLCKHIYQKTPAPVEKQTALKAMLSLPKGTVSIKPRHFF